MSDSFPKNPKTRQSMLLNDRVLRKHCVNVPRPRNTHEFMDREVVVTVSAAKLEFSRSVAVCIDPQTATNATQPRALRERCFFSRQQILWWAGACGCIQTMPHYKMLCIGHGPGDGSDGSDVSDGSVQLAGWDHKSKIA